MRQRCILPRMESRLESDLRGGCAVRKPTPPESTSREITKEFLRAVAPSGGRQTFRDSKCRGLLLRVGASGRKTWAYDYRDRAGKRQTYTFADADKLDPGEARKRVKTFGEDPAGEKRQAKTDAMKAASRTVEAFLDGRYWADYLSTAKSGAATQARIRAAWASFLGVDMSALDPAAIHRHRQGRLSDGISPQTLNRDRTAILAMLNRAVEWRLIDRNPLDDPAFKPLDAEDDKRVRWLGQRDEHEDFRDEDGKMVGERKRFEQALLHPRTPAYLRDMCILAMNTGLRRGELFGLRWPDVSIARAQLTVRAGTSKSNKARHVDLNKDALEVLERLDKVRHITGFVFVNAETDEPFTTLKKSWATLAARAQLEDFTFHDLRHDFASRLVQAGVDLYQVRDLLGHSSIVLTERYAHLAPHQKRAAVKLLESAA
jgi:integrase